MQQQLSITRTEVDLRKIASKYLAITAFTFAAVVALIEQTTYPVGNLFGMDLAYIAFPFLIFSVLFMSYEYSHALIKQIWQKKRLKILSLFLGATYALFYIFSTNIVAPPDVPVPHDVHSFILPLQVYGLMTIWPDVEFYSSALNLAGYFSVGNVLLVAALAILATLATTLLMHDIRNRLTSKRIKPGSLVGAVFTSLCTNACCCCAPVILPAVFAFFGLGASSSIVEDVTYQTMPIFNLLWLATLMFLLLSILFSVRRTDACRL